MIKLEVKVPFIVGTKQVAELHILPIPFVRFVDFSGGLLADLQRGIPRPEADRNLLRSRRREQVRAFGEDGSPIALDDIAFAQMPARLFAVVTKKLDDKMSPTGEIVGKGDGIDIPIIYKLGTPIGVQGTTEEATGKITELEILAKTGGDIEGVVSTDNPAEQTLALIRDCAKPIGVDAGLITMPSWAVDALTIEDGLTIMNKVLPGFLE